MAQKYTKLEEGLLQCMRALDKQVSRELQRTPTELETKGTRKWEPLENRVETVAAFLVQSLGEQAIELDSILIMAQALSKTLCLVVEDLGEKGLGKVRTEYCLSAGENIKRDSERIVEGCGGAQTFN